MKVSLFELNYEKKLTFSTIFYFFEMHLYIYIYILLYIYIYFYIYCTITLLHFKVVEHSVSHAETCRVALRKGEVASTFSATCNAIFRCETTYTLGVSHEEVFLATCNANAKKIASCDMALRHSHLFNFFFS